MFLNVKKLDENESFCRIYLAVSEIVSNFALAFEKSSITLSK